MDVLLNPNIQFKQNVSNRMYAAVNLAVWMRWFGQASHSGADFTKGLKLSPFFG